MYKELKEKLQQKIAEWIVENEDDLSTIHHVYKDKFYHAILIFKMTEAASIILDTIEFGTEEGEKFMELINE